MRSRATSSTTDAISRSSRYRLASLAATIVVVLGAAGCGAPSLSDPAPAAEVVIAEPASTTLPECTAKQAAAIDPRASYEPLATLPGPGQMPGGSSMERIVQRGKLRVGVSGDTFQFGARNPLTGTIEGFDISVLQEIALAIFGDADNRLDFVVIPYRDRIPKLKADEVDIVAHTMTINCKRWLQIAFSAVYYDAGQKVLVRADSTATDITALVAAKARICFPAASTNEEKMQEAAYADLQKVALPDATDCMVELQQGRIDAITADDTVLVGLKAQDPNVKIVGGRITDEPYGLGIAADRVDLVQFVNAVLEQMRASGRWAELYRQWVDPSDTDPQLPEVFYGRVPA